MTNSTAQKQDDERSSEMLAEYMEPLRAFLDDTSLNEICVNRPSEVWTEGRNGWQRFDVPCLTFSHCCKLAILIASYNGKSITANKPVLSAALPCGARVQVVIPPACETHTVSITIRKPSMVDKTLDELEAEGAFDQVENVDASGTLHPYEVELLALKKSKRIKEFLKLAMQHGLTLVIVGKTGSGKTTIGKSITNCIPTDERLVTVEDVHEMFLNHHPNKVHLFYSREGEGSLSINPKQAIASCLRMKPDRILLTEMRGDEAWEFIKAVGSGHPGISTAHAGGALEAFDQIVALIKDSATGAHLDAAYIKKRVFETVDIVLYYVHHKLREIYYDPEFKRKQLG